MIESVPLASDAVVYRWEWLLRSPPERLWPLVSDTNRINQLANMAPAQFTDTPLDGGGTERSGAARMLGLGVTWDEHPFEWVYPQGFSVLREFNNGVLKAYRSSVLLTPEAGGTRLCHMVELVPRVGLMAPFVRREGPKQQAHWDHAYRAIDAYLMEEAAWPFARTVKVRLSAPAQQMAAELEIDSPEPVLERRLFDHIMGEHEGELLHIRPFVLADRWRVSRDAMVAMCLYGVRRKLLEPQWSLLCPHCRGAKGTAASPRELANQIYCNACNIMFGRASDDVVELTFRPNPAYRRVQEASFCIGGPGSQPHVVFQCRLSPLSGRDVGLDVPHGGYRLRGPRIKLPCDLTFHAPAAAHGHNDTVEGSKDLPLFEVGPEGVQAVSTHVEGPRLQVRIVNTSEVPIDVLLETRDWRDDAVTLAHIRPLAASDPLFAVLGV